MSLAYLVRVFIFMWLSPWKQISFFDIEKKGCPRKGAFIVFSATKRFIIALTRLYHQLYKSNDHTITQIDSIFNKLTFYDNSVYIIK
jgi:hypothetical protein